MNHGEYFSKRGGTVVKRVFDVVVSLILCIALSPVMAGVWLLVRRTMGHPVLFRQERAGLYAKPFVLVKFRSMLELYGADGEPLPDSMRTHSVGAFLRRFSLDELPQLWNVVRGEISLVGPRPLPMNYLSHFSPEQARRQLVKPGITGWAQVNGRNAINWEEKFRLDVWYVDHRSFLLDMRILFMTVGEVIKGNGAIVDEGFGSDITN